MKKLSAKVTIIVLCIALLTLSLGLTACGRNEPEEGITRIRVGATPRPHMEILQFIAPYLLEEGIELYLIEFTEFGLVNPALSQNQIDANYFQHVPFLHSYIEASGNQLHIVGDVHVEPMGAYSQTLSHIDELFYGATVAIPDDATNGPRALFLLESYGFLVMDRAPGFRAGVNDILENPLNLQFIELAAAMLPRIFLDNQADLSIINTNHVLSGAPHINPVEDSLIMESRYGNPYANVLVVRPEDAENPAVLTLLRHLQSERVRQFILENYDGVVPVF